MIMRKAGLAFTVLLGIVIAGHPASATAQPATARAVAHAASLATYDAGAVTVWNDGWYLARFTVDWTNAVTLQRGHFDSGDIIRGGNRTAAVPVDARQIAVRAWAVAGRDIFTRNYPNPSRNCFRVGGTTLFTSYSEIACG